GRCTWCKYVQARRRPKEGLRTLGMLSPRAADCPLWRQYHQRNLELAAVHVTPFRRLVVDLVHCNGDEVGKLQLYDRSSARDRRADPCPNDEGLRYRSVEHTAFAEATLQAARKTKDAAEGNVFAHEKDVRIALQLL